MKECMASADGSLRLCPVGQEDRDVYLELAWAFYHSPAVLHAVPYAYLERTFEEMIRSTDYVEGFLLRNTDGHVMGYVLLSKTFSQEVGGRAIWIEEVYVLPDYQGQGVGSRALEMLFQRYPECCRFRLEVEPENHRAAQLYGRLGFEPLAYRQMIRDAKE